MAKDFDIGYADTSWYNSVRVRLSNKEYDEAIKKDNLQEVLQELYWEQQPEIIEITKPEYFIEEVEE